jgi:hypothetical protein
MVAIALLSILLAVTVSFYPLVIKTWNSGRSTYALRDDLSRVSENIKDYLTKASNFTVINPGRIIFTANIDPTTPAGESCVLYLYNANDTSWPTTYTYPMYELRFMTYTPGPGQPVFGGGRSILGDTSPSNATPFGLRPPPDTSFSSSGNQISITLGETRDNERKALSFEVRPRNL